mmetsp:Transcript_34640/g.49175  ORF Transcript_34640/g.49175 Transcript_34640/m.49175 type:complete len:267 (-) Transcript_34640:60-860(-)
MKVVSALTLLAAADALSVNPDGNNRRSPQIQTSRSNFIQHTAVTFFTGAAALSSLTNLPANAEGGEEGTVAIGTPDIPLEPTFTLKECKVAKSGKSTNCVSTLNVRNLDVYSPPWTFDVSPDDAFNKIKSVVSDDPAYEIIDEQSKRYLKVSAKRGTLTDQLIKIGNTRNIVSDEFEFVVNAKDSVVTFRGAEASDSPSVSDFGIIRNRLESIRKRAGVFSVMGGGITSDSYEGDRGNGPLSQLKAFYGLQSGKGFEDLYDDKYEY